METVYIVLLLLAVICFVLDAARVVTRVGLLGLGLAFFALVPLIIHIRAA